MELEVIEPDYYYHIYNRGINRQPIFACAAHYEKFLFLCCKYIPSYVDVLAYCLIPNHFHFLVYIHPGGVYSPHKGASYQLGCLFNAYAQWYNKSIDRTGGLFQSPFKRKKIQDQEYLKQVLYYIHRNPVHHGLVDNPEEYDYSSYTVIRNNITSFINREHALHWFDGPSHFIDYHKMRFEMDAAEFFDDF